jgi:hypothetical protein
VIGLFPGVKTSSGGIEMAVMEISVVPIGTDNPSISHYVAECVTIVKEKGLSYELSSMGTNVQTRRATGGHLHQNRRSKGQAAEHTGQKGGRGEEVVASIPPVNNLKPWPLVALLLLFLPKT